MATELEGNGMSEAAINRLRKEFKQHYTGTPKGKIMYETPNPRAWNATNAKKER